jgi:quinol monooxygenase YgiN
MIVEYIRYRIPEDRSAAFFAAYEAAEPSLRASPHCLGYELSRCVEAPESHILRIRWDSLAGHLQGFRASPEFRPFLRAVQPFIGDIEEMRHYEPGPLQWSR